MGVMRTIAMVLVAAAACGGGKDAAVCAREAHDLGELLSSMDHEMPPFYAGDAKLVLRQDLPPPGGTFGPTVVITSNGATLDGMPFEDFEVNHRLEEAHARGGIIYVAVDEAARWDEVQEVARRLTTAELMHPAFAFARPAAAVARPPRSKIDDEIDAIRNSDDAGNKATRFAEIMSKLVKGCPPLAEAFGSVGADSADSKADSLIRAIEPSLVKCSCSVDIPALRSGLFQLLYIDKPQSSFFVTLDPDATAIVLPPETPWRDAQAKLTPDARVWIPSP
jgi:hypothetical protein